MPDNNTYSADYAFDTPTADYAIDSFSCGYAFDTDVTIAIGILIESGDFRLLENGDFLLLG